MPYTGKKRRKKLAPFGASSAVEVIEFLLI
ncbi:unannotated protein [freshwater metagenome]|uniref:Unannotated protein n=1 Tax=freshwater metagenome TaxID=449393 RepID=A0A6J7TDD8_9ZZZZ